MPELEPTVLPSTVAASHLRACAAELDGAQEVELGELAKVITDLVTGQRLLSSALTRLAERVEDGQAGVLAAAPSPEVGALAQVLQAAAGAFGYSADALAESEPFAQIAAEFAGPDTRL
ncbi:hypothetical protein FHX82_002996 [Amycolatopsis bartoniae]|uniref:Uncharacterized protein n=1 Tax=Amycolatopsis bartoniae TaxID=941986 RepID=A0A8H9M677_9PSEU|nr:hypothetical protein [Amycolatopsis bartoniae]MBB2935942.1 hypothetical protein [Amycolatopsis bartoniae]TVT00481.1 hypothetical protein FNH07_31760 [Amycolatopsis bartoniae]GHF62961.1 hypothetical protein GCM10017566_40700 [Amycolatopsis bartoniae]